MYVKMLEAVSEMLKMPVASTICTERVKCAKLMLDKIIEGMQGDPSCSTPTKQTKEQINAVATTASPPKPPVKRTPKEDEVEIMVDAGIIKSIKNAKDDTMIQLDGIAYPWLKAIGRNFSEGKIL